jgi:hypothetical protein
LWSGAALRYAIRVGEREKATSCHVVAGQRRMSFSARRGPALRLFARAVKHAGVRAWKFSWAVERIEASANVGAYDVAQVAEWVSLGE